MKARITRVLPSVWIAHTAYDVVGGIWALFGIESFQKVTGRKTDVWLVKTVALLILVVGVMIGSAGIRKRVTPEVAGVAVGSGAALTAIDVYYASRGRISKVYLLDGLANAILIVGWVLAWRRKVLPGQ